MLYDGKMLHGPHICQMFIKPKFLPLVPRLRRTIYPPKFSSTAGTLVKAVTKVEADYVGRSVDLSPSGRGI